MNANKTLARLHRERAGLMKMIEEESTPAKFYIIPLRSPSETFRDYWRATFKVRQHNQAQLAKVANWLDQLNEINRRINQILTLDSVKRLFIA